MTGEGESTVITSDDLCATTATFKAIVRADTATSSENGKGGKGKEERGGVGGETEQVHGHGIEQSMSRTSFAVHLCLFMLVVPTAMILNES